MARWRNFRKTGVAAMLVAALSACQVRAGGGVENVVLVVNDHSWASRTVANHYAFLRRIPIDNIIHIGWPLDVETIDVDRFRTMLLQPVLTEIKRRNLHPQVDQLIWSSDFPFRI